MKVRQIVNAYEALRVIGAYRFPSGIQWDIYDKIEEVLPHIDRYLKEARKADNDPGRMEEILEHEVELSPALELITPPDLDVSYSDNVLLRGIIDLKRPDTEKAEGD